MLIDSPRGLLVVNGLIIPRLLVLILTIHITSSNKRNYSISSYRLWTGLDIFRQNLYLREKQVVYVQWLCSWSDFFAVRFFQLEADINLEIKTNLIFRFYVYLKNIPNFENIGSLG